MSDSKSPPPPAAGGKGIGPAGDRQRTFSSDSSQGASLSTTPTQSHVRSVSMASSAATPANNPTAAAGGGTLKGTPAGASGTIRSSGSNSQRESSSYDSASAAGASSTIGRGPAPRHPTAAAAVHQHQHQHQHQPSPQPRTAIRSDNDRSYTYSQRSVSYAPSDLDTVSAMSTSEYSSGAEDDNELLSPSGRTAQSRGRAYDVASGRAGPSPSGRPQLHTASSFSNPPRSASATTSATNTNTNTNTAQSGRRASASRARRQSQVVRDRYDDERANDDRYGPLDEEDDEVEPHDRGEELVRRRMKARQREKALRKRREKEAERERARQSVASPSSPHLKPGSAFSTGRPTSPSPQTLDRAGRPTTIALPAPAQGFANLQSGALSPGSLQSMTGFPSPRGTTGTNYPSPHAHIRRPSSGQGASRYSMMSYGQQTPVGGHRGPTYSVHGGQDPFSDSLAAPGSVGGRSSVDASSSVAGSIRADEDDALDEDEERDTIASLAAPRGGDQLADDDVQDEDTELLDGDTPDGEDSDVEYTLKDRQDAINIEHPFGLPIWKPALYKKSRSVTRNAETALHLIPSAAAERHLLPGNILWTIFFGSWLMVVCYLASFLLRIVPVGGSKYARVVRELGGYLFWPFGKYVEVEVSPESGDRTRPAAEFCTVDDGNVYENSFTPLAARFPHDHTHHVPFNSRPEHHGEPGGGEYDTIRVSETRPTEQTHHQADSSSSGSEARRSTPRASEAGNSSRTSHNDETTSLKGKGKLNSYGTLEGGEAIKSEEDRIEAETRIYGYVYDADGNDVGLAKRAGGRVAFAAVYAFVLFPLMGIVCLACWGMVFTVPMAKLNWALIKNLAAQPLALHFRSAPGIERPSEDDDEQGDESGSGLKGRTQRFFPTLQPGQPAPRSKSISQGKGSMTRRSKILLCTYRAVGSQYYKYTLGGVNILFVNTLPLVFFTIFDFFVIEKYVEHHHIEHGLLPIISSQGVIFLLSLASVIPLSYFIGMAVASISAQSSIGMGAVINATFGSIIEIILYAIALTQDKARLVEGSLVGSILAGVLLMPGLSMCSGATRRKEQRFNARSAGVTSTMLIMAIIGILTPTLFYQIYGTFQLTCEGCPADSAPGDTWTCKRCFYEHVPPATDPFFQQNVRGLMYTCTVILVLSYAIGLWFSLRTHASQIWQNPQPAHHAPVATGTHAVPTLPSAQRASIYKRLVPAAVMQQLLPTTQQRPASQAGSSSHGTVRQQQHKQAGDEQQQQQQQPPPLRLPEQFSQEDYERAVAITASAFHNALRDQQQQPARPNAAAASGAGVGGGEEDNASHGGHDAPSWSRGTSVSVLLGCTVLYAIIAEILVDVVDVVLDGSGIDEKFLGITLFALVPNTTEFMNAMSFAINGNIALSMEIGSAYALQVCLIQIPAMVAFSAYRADTNPASMFTLIFPRWDVIAIIFAVFLLTYTYIESRSNYYRGSICILSYTVLVAGFYFAPPMGDVETPGDDGRALWHAAPIPSPSLSLSPSLSSSPTRFMHASTELQPAAWAAALVGSLWTR